MKDFWDSLRQQLGDRFSSPIFGSFVISWIAWNHKYLLILFSNEPIEKRLAMSEKLVYPGDWDFFLRAGVWPLFSCIIYVLAYPWASQGLLVWWDKRQKVVAERRNAIMSGRLLTREESRKIILEAIEQRKQHEEMIERHAREVDALRNSNRGNASEDFKKIRQQNLDLLAEIERLRSSAAPQNPLAGFGADGEKSARAMLAILSKAPEHRLSRHDIAHRMKTSVLKADVAIEDAKAAGFIEEISSALGGGVRLVAKGKQFVVREKLDEDTV